jgi:dTDP-4-dehydrorhamnose 3,5-epimerase
VLEPRVLRDERGYFIESFNQRSFAQATGLDVTFVQDNHSRSSCGVLRGLHYQLRHPQGKLVRVSQGAVFDVAVDLRRHSPTFGRWFGTELSADNALQLWIPAGFAHGYQVLSEAADFQYKTTQYWHPEHERGVSWCDPALAIDWPECKERVLSAKDMAAPLLARAEVFD